MKLKGKNLRGIVREAVADHFGNMMMNEDKEEKMREILKNALRRKYGEGYDEKKINAEVNKMMKGGKKKQKTIGFAKKSSFNNYDYGDIYESKVDRIINGTIREYLR